MTDEMNPEVEESGLGALVDLEDEAMEKAGKLPSLQRQLARRTICARDFLENPPPKSPTMVEGLFRRSNRVGLVAQIRSRKSFLALQLGLCIASGYDFLDYPCRKSRTLIANLELPDDEYWDRYSKMLKGLPITVDDLNGWLFFGNYEGVDVSADGDGETSPGWDAILNEAKRHNAECVIIDPYYMMAGDENDIREAKRTVRAMRKFTREGIFLVVVFHGTKGLIGDKQVVDRISGSSVVARDCVIVSIAPHATLENGFVFEKALRSFPDERGAETILFNQDGYFVRSDAAPVVAYARSVSGQGKHGMSPTTEQVLNAIGNKAYTCSQFQDKMKIVFNMGRNAADDLRKDLVARGLLDSWTAEQFRHKPTYIGTEAAIREIQQTVERERQRKLLP